uniref:Reverse transcriptase domain-containing protein n=1 Tax=Strongyloides venezuelensis TaxID=75913 RepID=A0A0K0FNQ3_STRVS
MPIIILNKSVGRKRVIGDMRSINSIVQPIYYSFPLINHAILKMRNCNCYTKLDCNNAYFQISVPVESQKYLTVKTPFGDYQFKRMVQRYINSSSEFHRLGEKILHGLEEFCTNYIDDIVIHTVGSLEFHISKVKEVLLRMHFADLRISFDKCSFFGRSVKYLGFHINENGSMPHEGNIKPFLRRLFPESKKALKSLVASANYYRNYIENFAEITKLIWNDDVKESYEKLINAMSNPKFCHYPVHKDDFILTTDSSNHSIRGVLSQLRNDKEVPISFYSKRLSPTKRKRCATYKELMAISRCFRHFKYYFGGIDKHYLELTNDLAVFDNRIHYVKGSSNVVADDLSRETYNPNDLEFSGDEDESDIKVNVIKCIKVADFFDRVNIDAYNTDENSDCDNVSDDELINTIESNVLKNQNNVMIKHK